MPRKSIEPLKAGRIFVKRRRLIITDPHIWPVLDACIDAGSHAVHAVLEITTDTTNVYLDVSGDVSCDGYGDLAAGWFQGHFDVDTARLLGLPLESPSTHSCKYLMPRPSLHYTRH